MRPREMNLSAATDRSSVECLSCKQEPSSCSTGFEFEPCGESAGSTSSGADRDCETWRSTRDFDGELDASELGHPPTWLPLPQSPVRIRISSGPFREARASELRVPSMSGQVRASSDKFGQTCGTVRLVNSFGRHPSASLKGPRKLQFQDVNRARGRVMERPIVVKTIDCSQFRGVWTIHVDGYCRVFAVRRVHWPEFQSFVVLIVYSGQPGHGRSEEVRCCFDDGNYEMMAPDISQQKLLSFSKDWNYCRPPSKFQVQIKFSAANTTFQYTQPNSRMDELWVGAANRQFTDVEFIVGDQVFPAHRAVVAARSPVFSAMFQSDMVEARTGKVNICDVEPQIFAKFLKFLYTAHWTPSADDEKLLVVADKYQVDSLVKLCSNSTEDMVAMRSEDLLAVLIELVSEKSVNRQHQLFRVKRPDNLPRSDNILDLFSCYRP